MHDLMNKARKGRVSAVSGVREKEANIFSDSFGQRRRPRPNQPKF